MLHTLTAATMAAAAITAAPAPPPPTQQTARPLPVVWHATITRTITGAPIQAPTNRAVCLTARATGGWAMVDVITPGGPRGGTPFPPEIGPTGRWATWCVDLAPGDKTLRLQVSVTGRPRGARGPVKVDGVVWSPER